MRRTYFIPHRAGTTPTGGGGGGGGTFSVVNGLLQFASNIGGSAQIGVRWDRATTYNDASTYFDPKTHRLYVGTSAGASDVINGVDLSTTAQPGATHCVITGLNSGSTYYVRVKAISSIGNESSASTEQSFVAAAAPSLPGSWDGNISATTTISASGNYRITAGFTGTITISASNVLLYGQDFTLTHSAGGVILAAGVANVEIRNIVFNATSTGRCIQINGDLGSGNTAHHCAFTQGAANKMIGDAAGTNRDLGGMRFYANTYAITQGASGDVGGFGQCTNFRLHGETMTSTAAARSSLAGECPSFEAWGNTHTFTSGLQGTAYSGYETAGPHYIHDNTFNMDGSTDARSIVFDGGRDLTCLYNTWVMSTAPPGDYRALRIRASDGRDTLRTMFGFNTFNMRSTAGNVLIQIGDTSSGGGAFKPRDNYVYYNTVTNPASGGRPIDFYGGSGFGDLTTWNNTLLGQLGTASGGTWDMNNDSLATGVLNTAANWNAFNCTIGGSTGSINIVGAWTGFNPNSKTPSAPTNLRAI